MVEVIPLRYDAAFKKAFSQSQVFVAFVKDILGIELEIDQVQRSYRYPKPVGSVDIEYDLFAEDKKSRAIVEIQHVKLCDLFDRFLYYFLIALAEQIKSSQRYQFDREVYTIVVLTSPTDIDYSMAMGRIEFIDEFRRKVELYAHRIAFLIPPLVNDRTPEAARPWLELINDSLDRQVNETRYTHPVLQQVIDAIAVDNISPQEMQKLIDERAWEDTLADVREEGREEGRAEGMKQGLEEGFQQGRAEGEQHAKRQIARSMLQAGIDIETIVTATGLNQDVIESLFPASTNSNTPK
ncbi:PD-(D/E)XK nuclease family transposase [Candidatus Poribacteria bacterium]|nr:PD-(D/E)XK nuclease family transposase [Candidatus Poribacteria bacterium]